MHYQIPYKKVMTGCCGAKINIMWLAHVVRMRLSQEVETFSRLESATRAVQISSIINYCDTLIVLFKNKSLIYSYEHYFYWIYAKVYYSIVK